MNAMRNRVSGSDRFADASAAAVSALVQGLEANGVATNDLWEDAIESSHSFVNETSQFRSVRLFAENWPNSDLDQVRSLEVDQSQTFPKGDLSHLPSESRGQKLRTPLPADIPL